MQIVPHGIAPRPRNGRARSLAPKRVKPAAAVANEHEIVVIGSQAVLGQFPNAPEALLVSIFART